MQTAAFPLMEKLITVLVIPMVSLLKKIFGRRKRKDERKDEKQKLIESSIKSTVDTRYAQCPCSIQKETYLAILENSQNELIEKIMSQEQICRELRIQYSYSEAKFQQTSMQIENLNRRKLKAVLKGIELASEIAYIEKLKTLKETLKKHHEIRELRRHRLVFAENQRLHLLSQLEELKYRANLLKKDIY